MSKLLQIFRYNFHVHYFAHNYKQCHFICFKIDQRRRNIWDATWQNQQNECAPSEDSDQPGHPPTSLYAQWVAKDPSFLYADSEDSDQTGRMPRLLWVFAGRTLTLLVLSCRGSIILLLWWSYRVKWDVKGVRCQSKDMFYRCYHPNQNKLFSVCSHSKPGVQPSNFKVIDSKRLLEWP